jgi:hypothetical protein
MNFIKMLILSWMSQNLDDILGVFTKLDARLDAYILKQSEIASQNHARIELLAQHNNQIADDVTRAQRTRTKIRDITG